MSYQVSLIRRNEGGRWCVLNKEMQVGVTEQGVAIRTKQGNTLWGDFPCSVLKQVQLLTPTLIGIDAEGARIALRFGSAEEASACLRNIAERCVRGSGTTNVQSDHHVLPALNDPLVQELILKLLCNRDFKLFVSTIAQILKEIQEAVELNN
jgi:hypothetical protein